MEKFIAIVLIIAALVFVFRMLGTWMLRINIVIRELKFISAELQAMNKQMGTPSPKNYKQIPKG